MQIKTGELLARIEAHLQPEDTVVGQVITVLGSKGGVGTTTVAVNLIMALRKAAQKKGLLLDWQRPLGDVAFLLGLPETHDLLSLEKIMSHFVNVWHHIGHETQRNSSAVSRASKARPPMVEEKGPQSDGGGPKLRRDATQCAALAA